MIRGAWHELGDWLGARAAGPSWLRNGDHQVSSGTGFDFQGVATDTRRLLAPPSTSSRPLRESANVVIPDTADCARPVFVALRGERFDAHDHVDQRLIGVVAGAIVERELPIDLPQWVVPDSLAALQQLAALWRTRMSARVIGITGSNGKTSTKEMLRAVLELVGPTLATKGNLNNHIGVPLTLLRLEPKHDFAVIEMGANHVGEIATLAATARPDLGVVTNAGHAHLEGFGSLEGVGQGKGEMYDALSAGGIAVINDADRFAPAWRHRAAAKGAAIVGARLLADKKEAMDAVAAGDGRAVSGPSGLKCADGDRSAGEPIWVGQFVSPAGLRVMHAPADTGEVVSAHIDLAVPGRHVAANALMVVAIASALGVPLATIERGLQRWRPIAGRYVQRRHVSGAVVIDDTYNANPDSVIAGIDALLESSPSIRDRDFVKPVGADGDRAEPHSGRRVLVLGTMAELGDDAAVAHSEMGRLARDRGLDSLWAVGDWAAHAARAFGDGALDFGSPDAAGEALDRFLKAGDSVLIKGSRSAGLEAVLQRLRLDSKQFDTALGQTPAAEGSVRS